MGTLDISDQSPFTAIGAALVRNVEAAVPKLRAISESRAEQPRAPGKWSPKQVIGHLIDSAANNHQRFVRAQEGESYTGPGYKQDHWVAVQGYQEASWDDLVALWCAYNRHLARHDMHDRLGRADDAGIRGVRLRPPRASSPGPGRRVARLSALEIDSHSRRILNDPVVERSLCNCGLRGACAVAWRAVAVVSDAGNSANA
jgi:hypothetical protein